MARLVYPQTLTLDSTNVAASTLDEWSDASVSYTIGNEVKYTTGQALPNHTFRAITDHTSSASNAPEIGGTSNWFDLGATNQHAMFDGFNNNRTVADASEDIEVSFTPEGRARFLYLTGLRNAKSVTVEEETTAGVQSTITIDLQKSRNPVGAWAWLLDIAGIDRYYARSVVIRLPGMYHQPQLNVTLESGAGPAECAQVIVGTGFDLGTAEEGGEPGIKDFSTFEQDEFGVTKFVPRQNTRKLRGTIWVDTEQYDRIYSLFEDRIGQLVLLDLNNSDGGAYSIDPFRVYGKIDSFSGGLEYEKTPINLTISGLE
jgi:hypothetical protein